MRGQSEHGPVKNGVASSEAKIRFHDQTQKNQYSNQTNDEGVLRQMAKDATRFENGPRREMTTLHGSPASSVKHKNLPPKNEPIERTREVKKLANDI